MSIRSYSVPRLEEMLVEGIIEESSSAWLAPAVFVKKKTGDIRLCVDYRELDKRTTKDAYPLPRPDEVQDQLAGSQVFSTLDLQCGNCQYTQQTATTLPLAQDLVWDFFSFAECLLGLLEPLHLSSG